MGGGGRGRGGGKQCEGKGRREERKQRGNKMCKRTAASGETVNKGVSAFAAQWKWARISLIGMQIGFLPTVCHGARGEREAFGIHNVFIHINIAVTPFMRKKLTISFNYQPHKWHHRAETWLQPRHSAPEETFSSAAIAQFHASVRKACLVLFTYSFSVLTSVQQAASSEVVPSHLKMHQILNQIIDSLLLTLTETIKWSL